MKVKICGLTTQEAVDEAVQDGADFIGFVFAKSRRQILPEKVTILTSKLPQSVKKVGVFVSPTTAELAETVRKAGLDIVQIHGKMPDMTTLDIPVIRAASVVEGKLPDHLKSEHYDYLLLDAPPREYQGGNGEVFDWQAVDKQRLEDQKVFIAGGLKAENVEQAADYFEPYAVDVSSGVETDGKKDLEKIREFLQAAKIKK